MSCPIYCRLDPECENYAACMSDSYYLIPSVLNKADIAHVLREVSKIDHHSDEDNGHALKVKPHNLAQIANKFNPHLKEGAVDPMMVLYHLTEGKGVSEHRDEDFDGSDGKRATLSMLIPLNGHEYYLGGSTMFGKEWAPQAETGGALIFDHRILHSARPVLWGSRFVLKTDIFT